MLIFLDTEFTGLGQPDPKLISLALVPADGRREFYAELAVGEGWTHGDCSDFVCQEVLPILNGGKFTVSADDLKIHLLAWFAAMPRSIQVACDSEIDFRFLKAVLADGWPDNLVKRYFDLRPMVDTTIYDRAVQRYYTPDRLPHNALADAQAYRLGWLAWADAHKKGI